MLILGIAGLLVSAYQPYCRIFCLWLRYLCGCVQPVYEAKLGVWHLRWQFVGGRSARSQLCAASGQFDMAAAILLVCSAFGKCPFLCIAIFRYNAIRRLVFPLPVSQGIAKAKRHIVLHIALFALVVMLLPLSGYTGIGFLTVAFATIWWLLMALRGYRPDINLGLGKTCFGFSIVNITLLSIAMSLDYHTSVTSLFAVYKAFLVIQ